MANTVTVASGVISTGLRVLLGDELDVLSGGQADQTLVYGGAEYISSGGVASGSVVNLLGVEYVTNGGIAVGTVVSGALGGEAGGVQYVSSGGMASATVVDGGDQYIEDGGVASGAVVNYGVQWDYGVTSATTVNANGLEVVAGLASGTILSGGGAEVYGFASGTLVTDGGVEEVYSGGQTSGAVVSNGLEYILSGAMASGAVLSDGGLAVVLGFASGTLVTDGAAQYVEDGGSVSATQVSGGGLELVGGGSVANGTVVSNGGLEIVRSGGQEVDGTVSQGGILRVGAGVTFAVQVPSGGAETIFAPGQASGTMVSGGHEYDYGQASGTVILAGGQEFVGGTASGAMISSGGREIVLAGGTAAGANLFAGGTLMVRAGGTVSGGLTISAGQATILGAMGSGQTVSFAGAAGTLALNNLPAFSASIAGLSVAAQKIDLGGFTFSAGETVGWTQSGTSGTLTVQDGPQTANLTLIGTYVVGDFHLANDKHGGTFVTDPRPPPHAVPAATRFVQAVAGFEGGRAAAGVAAIHDGGTALIGTSPLVGVATSGR